MIASKLLTAASKQSSGARCLLQTLIRQSSSTSSSILTTATNLTTDTKREFATAATSSAAKTLTAGDTLTELMKLNPHKEIIRYEHKNVKWTIKNVDDYSEMLAIGLLENQLIKGDAVLSLMPDHWAEQHILQFACSKAGLVLYTLDSKLASDPDTISQALTLTNATVLVSPETHDEVNYVDILKNVIPEIQIFDFSCGMPFITPRFPHLRFPIHTGFDHQDKWGMLPYKQFLVPSENLDVYRGAFGLEGSTPFYASLSVGEDGRVSVGEVMTNDEVVKSGVLPVFSSILNREYREVEGVGVVF